MKNTARDRKYFFDLNHPADFHFFKNLFSYLQENGYSYRVMARNKECLHELLRAEGIPFISRGRGSHFLLGKYIYAAYILLLSFIQLSIYRPGLTLSLSSPYLIIVSKFLRIPTLTYDDTDYNPRLLPHISKADYIFSPANYPHTFHENHFHIQTFKELAYLTKPGSAAENPGDAVFFRITRTDSVHHSSETRMDAPSVWEEIQQVSKNHTSYLSHETGLDEGRSSGLLIPDKVNIHSDLKKCRVFWGNSATMAAEAVVLGIPSIYIGNEKFAYLKEMEDNGLLFCFTPDKVEASFKKLNELLLDSDPGKRIIEKRARLFRDKINITGLIIWFIENLPDSAGELQEDEDIQLRFKAQAIH